MFLKFFPDEPTRADAFAADVGGADLSMAVLQSFFMLYRHSAAEASDAAAELRAGALGAAREGTPVQQQMARSAVRRASDPLQQRRTAASPAPLAAAEAEKGPGAWDGDPAALGCVPAGPTKLR